MTISTFLLTSIGQEWQFHITTDIYWSRMTISHGYSYSIIQNGNLTLLLTSNGHEWQFHIPIAHLSGQRIAISHCY